MLFADYLNWHYTRAPWRILVIAKNFSIFFFHYFSVKYLVRGLFSPWKRQIITKSKPGFHPEEILNVISFNLISRTLGGIVRLTTLFIWLITEILVLFLGIIIFLLWLIIPVITFPFYLYFKPKTEVKVKSLPAFLKTKSANFTFRRLGIDPQEITQLVASSTSLPVYPTNQAETVIWEYYLKNWPALREYCLAKKLKNEYFIACSLWFERLRAEQQQQKHFWNLSHLLKHPGIGKDWLFGYTPTLDQYTTDLGQDQIYSHHLVGRGKTTNLMERILTRSQNNNLILVGEPGIGKHTIVLNLAKKIKEGRINPALAYKRILEINLNLILANSPSLIESKGVLENLLKEASLAGNIILVIDQMASYFSSSQGKINLEEIFLKFLPSGKLQIIGITTPDEFQKELFPQDELMTHFQKIEAVAPNIEEAKIILEDITPILESRQQVFVFYQSIVEAIEKSDQFLINIPFPEKAIELLDDACVYTANSGGKLVTPKEIDLVLSQKTQIPLGDLEKDEVEKLKNLESILHQRIVNQNEAITALAKAMRRSRLEITKKEQPLGTFLFLGPTGVGKTETAKALATAYFANERSMIRFDMAEYQGEIGILKALGNPQTKEPGIFAKEIRNKPFAVLLLDEIEKTDPKILNLFLVILDEGYFTDNFGEKIDCRHLIMIGTSNAGSEYIREQINQGIIGDQLNKNVFEFIQKAKIFSPEFLNRFGAVIVYRPLTPENLQQIARLLLNNLNERLTEKEIKLKITDSLVSKIVELGYQPTLGARPMARVIQDQVEDVIAQKILNGQVNRGGEVEIEI